MSTINLKSYAPIVSDEITGDAILTEIKELLKSEEVICIDMRDIKSMATFCAKQIFGQLYKELGSDKFFNRIEIKNATDNVKSIIRIGIESIL